MVAMYIINSVDHLVIPPPPSMIRCEPIDFRFSRLREEICISANAKESQTVVGCKSKEKTLKVRSLFEISSA